MVLETDSFHINHSLLCRTTMLLGLVKLSGISEVCILREGRVWHFCRTMESVGFYFSRYFFLLMLPLAFLLLSLFSVSSDCFCGCGVTGRNQRKCSCFFCYVVKMIRFLSCLSWRYSEICDNVGRNEEFIVCKVNYPCHT